ncbi:M23 family metallopeptidase [Proteinivorax hydrogeniformans]|uniref:M23 family metallopeptidase n=1 Tax=Proteinivorax hydrogeniformans TaxID=1826727 RepID=A0AAU8HVF9_9FIRM
MNYKVKKGDTLYKIAKKHGLSLSQLLALNPSIENPDIISVGQTITVRSNQELKTYKVQANDTLSSIATKHGITWQQLYQQNKDIIKDPNLINVGMKLKIPKTKTNHTPKNQVVQFFTNKGWTITSDYGIRTHPISGNKTFHRGIDFAGKPKGEPVKTPISGTIKYSNYYSGWGNLVGVEDNQGFIHLFAHLHRRTKKAGQTVAKGDTVGLNGSTGNSTGPHVHYQINTPGGGVGGSYAHANPKMFPDCL